MVSPQEARKVRTAMPEEKMRTAEDMEKSLTLMLKHLPIALTITKRDVDRYAWQWLQAQGEGDSFLNALENALTHMETEYMQRVVPQRSDEEIENEA
jgi:hypothetical protein